MKVYVYGKANRDSVTKILSTSSAVLASKNLKLDSRIFRGEYDSDFIEFKKHVHDFHPDVVFLHIADFTYGSLAAFFSLLQPTLKERQILVFLVLNDLSIFSKFPPENTQVIYPDKNSKPLSAFLPLEAEAKSQGFLRNIFGKTKVKEQEPAPTSKLNRFFPMYEFRSEKIYFNHFIPTHELINTDLTLSIGHASKKLADHALTEACPFLPDLRQYCERESSKYDTLYDLPWEGINLYLKKLDETSNANSQHIDNPRSGNNLDRSVSLSEAFNTGTPNSFFKELSKGFTLQTEYMQDFPTWDGKKLYTGNQANADRIQSEIDRLLHNRRSKEDKKRISEINKKLAKEEHNQKRSIIIKVRFLESLFEKSMLKIPSTADKNTEVLVLSYNKEFFQEISIENKSIDFIWLDLQQLSNAEGVNAYNLDSYESFLQEGTILIDKESNVRFRYALNKLAKAYPSKPLNTSTELQDSQTDDVADQYTALANELFLENITAYYKKITPILELRKKEKFMRTMTSYCSKTKLLFIMESSEIIPLVRSTFPYPKSEKIQFLVADIEQSPKEGMKTLLDKTARKLRDKDVGYLFAFGGNVFLNFIITAIRKNMKLKELPIVALTNDWEFNTTKHSELNSALVYLGYDFLIHNNTFAKNIETTMEHFKTFV